MASPPECLASLPPPLCVFVPKPTESAPFDFGAEPPFTLKDIRQAIPAKCFKKNTLRSLSYLARDVVVVAGLTAGALAIKNPWLWPAYWAAQGTMFWALFVIGHDCGHGSFSDNKLVNSVVGEPFDARFHRVQFQPSACTRLGRVFDRKTQADAIGASQRSVGVDDNTFLH